MPTKAPHAATSVISVIDRERSFQVRKECLVLLFGKSWTEITSVTFSPPFYLVVLGRDHRFTAANLYTVRIIRHGVKTAKCKNECAEEEYSAKSIDACEVYILLATYL
jgi:hypothetical protein